MISKGQIYLTLKDFGKAKEVFTQALKLAEQSEGAFSLLTAYSYLGTTEKMLGNNAGALEYFLKLERLRSESNVKVWELSSFINIADAYDALGQFDKAAAYADGARWKNRAPSATVWRNRIRSIPSRAFGAVKRI